MGTFVITPELRAKFVDSMNTAANAASEMSNSFRMLSELAGNGADISTLRNAMKKIADIMEKSFEDIASAPPEWIDALNQDDESDKLAGAGESASHE